MKFIKFENCIVNISLLEHVWYSDIEMIFQFNKDKTTHIETPHEDLESVFYLARTQSDDQIHEKIFEQFLQFMKDKDSIVFDLSDLEETLKKQGAV